MDQWANQFSRALEGMVLIQAVFTIDAVLIVIVIVGAFVAVNIKNYRKKQPKIIKKSVKKSIKIDQKSIKLAFGPQDAPRAPQELPKTQKDN